MDLLAVKKIGPKSVQILNKLDIRTVQDLLTYYPYRYNVYRPSSLNEINDIDVVCVNATIESTPKVSYIRRNFNRLSFKALANDFLINVVIFNRAFMVKNLDVGKNVCLIGKYNKQKNSFVANDIKLGWITDIKIEPVYHITKGIKNKEINSFIQNAFLYVDQLLDYIPKSIQENYHFLSKEEAIREIHNPKSSQKLKQARLRCIYEEFFVFMLKINYLKNKNENIKGIKKEYDEEKLENFLASLPFELTTDQISAVNDCLKDLKSSKKMNRLIQGDVGSGKTIVATITMVANAYSGYQSALMAPTEILAKQHYDTISFLLKDFDIRVCLLTGSVKKKEYEEILKQLKNGEIDILIGTHSLINEEVQFKNLGLVITDEQHRFGVNQRGNLQNKGILPDTIYMSATPIPRTYALTIYQDMDTSLIKTKPNGRKEIKTYVKKESELKSVLEHILKEIKLGHQIYVVAPSITENEERNVHDVQNLKKSFFLAFQGKINIDVLHGKIKAKEKEEIMARFKSGETKILIATTVIEVGVDVKNATTIVIFNAEMFGLATLHQLRGRVGRNDLESTCFLISDYDIERLKVLEQSNDGFYISEQDFLMRREGDLFGTRQSGDMIFKIADLKKDFKILLQTKEDSKIFLRDTKNMEEKYEKILKSISHID